ncbi:MAG: restriction endonuclease subunit S [Limnohabitans sp.]
MKAGWTYKNLADLCTFFGDGDWIESKDQSSNGIRLIQTGNVGEGVFKDRGDKARYINEDTFARLRCTEIFEGDCLISRLPDPVGRSAILPDTGERMITAVDCTVIRFDPQLCLPEFFNYYSQSTEYINNISERCTGTTRNRISRSQLGNTPIPTSDIGEQRRIVTLLDEAFADIATAKANAEKNLQNARELLNSHLDAIVVHAQENGEIVALSELATDITDGDHMPPPKVEHGLPFITIGNIDKQTRSIDFSDTFKVPREYFDALKANKKPMRGDVLYTVTGSFGIPVLVEDDAEFCFQRHIGLIRPKADVDSTWLHYLLQSPQVFNQAADGATGTAQKTVSLKVLRNLQVPRISPKDQLAHVETLRSVEAECRRLESIYRQKLTALDDLKKSLLHQAFSGQLTQ